MELRCAVGLNVATTAAFLLLSSVLAVPVWAQVTSAPLSRPAEVRVDEIESATRAELDRARSYVAQSKWSEAIDLYREIATHDPGRLIPHGGSGYISIREYCARQLAALPPPGLRIYRERFDPIARGMYEQAVAARSEPDLRELVNQFFVSSWTDDALLMLGDMAIERGAYHRARSDWERIHPALRAADGRSAWLSPIANGRPRDQSLPDQAPATSRPLAYPDTNLDLAMVRARLVWASILEGHSERAKAEHTAFMALHPGARGRWGGRDADLGQSLAAALTSMTDSPALSSAVMDWPTFAGSPERTVSLPRAVDVAGSAWSAAVDLPAAMQADMTLARQYGQPARRVGEDYDELLSYHPIVVGDLCLVANERQIAAYDRRTGKPAFGRDQPVIYQDWGSQSPGTPGPFRSELKRTKALGVPRFTLSAHQGKVFARLGDPLTVLSPEATTRDRLASSIVWLDLAAEGALVQQVRATDKWSFDGTPVSDGSGVYVAMRYSEVRSQIHVACFDIDTGKLRWRQLVCSSETLGHSQVDEITHNLLTLHEDVLYLNTNLGAVAAVDKQDGQVRWVTTYSRSRPDAQAAYTYRDLNPCVFYRGVVIAVPSDSPAVFALDAATGQLLWENVQPEDAIHLLGVGAHRVICSGSRLWWLDLYTGKTVGYWADPAVKGYGRGLLAGGHVYWPTRAAIFVFDQAQPGGPSAMAAQARQPILLTERGLTGATGGNLAYAQGQLLVATSKSLYSLARTPNAAYLLARPAAGIK